MAKATKTPELALDEMEAKTMAASVLNVAKHYNIKTSQKAIDWTNLLITMTLIYGGKLHAVGERKKSETAARRAQAQADAAPFGLAAAPK